MEAIAIPQLECFGAAVQSPAPRHPPPPSRPTPSLRPSARPRLQGDGEEKVILTALCGHGHFDLAAYTPTWRAHGRRGGSDEASSRALHVPAVG